MHNQPAEYDVVLGGNNPGEIISDAIASAAVLGGQGKYLALLFDWFNSEANQCNQKYFRLKLGENVALVGQIDRQPIDDLKIKVKYKAPRFDWQFAGWLKHGGVLFTPVTATYEHGHCIREVRGIAYQALIQKAWELGGLR